MLNLNHMIIFKLIKNVSFSYQHELVELFESKSVPYQVYLALLVSPTVLCKT